MNQTPLSAEEAALLEAIEPLLLAATEGEPSLDRAPESPISLRSIEVITLVDLLEARFDVVLTSDDVRPAHFESRRSLAALLFERGARCG